MSDRSSIEWTDATWNPIRGCSRVSQGCVNCYAESVAARFSGPGQAYEGLIHPKTRGWNGTIGVVEHALTQPLRWRRPRRIFVNSMSDLFHENVPEHVIDTVFTVMVCAWWHTFQVLTKRPQRMLEYCTSAATVGRLTQRVAQAHEGVERQPEWTWANDGLPGFHAKNVWLGVSVEDQATANERIPLLLKTPAAVRFLSCEPLLGPLAFRWAPYAHEAAGETYRQYLERKGNVDQYESLRQIDWVIVGGESGPKARPFEIAWARSIVEQCRAAGVACFVKQLGARVYDRNDSEWMGDFGGGVDFYPLGYRDDAQGATCRPILSDRKGGDPAEWPEDLRVRDVPKAAA